MPRRTSQHRDPVQDPNTPQPSPDTPIRWSRIAIALGVVVLGVIVLNTALDWVQNMVGEMKSINQQQVLSSMMIGALILYAILIACPFMPGIEVGVALLMLQGAQIAPFVYLATVTGLMLAYLIGRLVPLASLSRIFDSLGLTKAAILIKTIQTTAPEDRLAQQRDRLPGWLGKLTVDYRYLTVGLLLNVPGTFAIGGGGGILMVAGISRLFNGWAMLGTLLIATIPVPLTVWIMGTQIMG